MPTTSRAATSKEDACYAQIKLYSKGNLILSHISLSISLFLLLQPVRMQCCSNDDDDDDITIIMIIMIITIIVANIYLHYVPMKAVTNQYCFIQSIFMN